jgi:hypothetical protein
MSSKRSKSRKSISSLELLSRLPQDIQDMIFLDYLNNAYREVTRDMQSQYVKKKTQYDTLEKAVKNGNKLCVKYLLDKGEIPKSDLKVLASCNEHNDLAKWLSENKNKYKGLDFDREYNPTSSSLSFARRN